MRIAFIGGGNMASAMIKGMLQQGWDPAEISVADPEQAAKARLTELGVRCFDAAPEAIRGADGLVLAVKPQVLPQVLSQLGGQLAAGQWVLSIAAGVTLATLSAALGHRTPLIRCMPNTPALIGMGISGLCAGAACTPAQRLAAERLLGTVGHTVWIENEAHMDVVTAVSGSGPAYFYLLCEALRDAGVAQGLDAETATRLALHTAAGAGLLALRDGASLEELRARVSSKGGTTVAAVEVLEAGGFRALVNAAVESATRRGRELAEGKPK